MFQWTKTAFFLGLLLVVGTTVFAQKNRKQLEEQQNAINKEIEYKNKLLKETRQNSRSALNELAILRQKIADRELLISTIQAEIRLIDNQIANKEQEIAGLQHQLETLKSEYAEMIKQVYRTRSSYDKIMFILASEDVNQAYTRIKYLQQYSEYRKQQADNIINTQKLIGLKVEELQAQKQEKQNLLSIELNERKSLSNEKSQQESTVKELEKKEKQLKVQLAKDKEERKNLQRAIEKAIADAVKKSTRKGSKAPTLTPEAQALSDDFASNQRKLPWPVEKGVITEYFGEHPHPVLRGVKIKNNGLNISTAEGAAARAVFSGEVTHIIMIPGAGTTVMVRHGSFLTIYSNLKQSYVAVGDVVKTKESIGIIMSDQGKTELHFEIWKDTTTLNPASWLYNVR